MAQVDPALLNQQPGAPAARMVQPTAVARQQQQAAQRKVVQQPADGKSITVNFREYMQMQNSTAHNYNVFHSMATNQMYAASQNISAVTAAMVQLQQNFKSQTAQNGVDAAEIDFGHYPALNDLLNSNHELINNPLANLNLQRGGAGGGINIPVLAGMQPKKQRKQRKPKDPNAPKRPITAFFLFSREERDRIRDELKRKKGTPDVKPGEVQKEIQDQWNAMDDHGQQKWKNLYLKEMEKYRQEVDKWKKAGGDGAPPAPPADEDAAEAEEEEEEEEESDSSEESSEEEPPPPPPVKKEKKSKKRDATPEPEPKKKKAGKADSPERKRKADAPAAAVEGQKKKKKGDKRRDTGEYGDDY